jgi:putative hemolysin
MVLLFIVTVSIALTVSFLCSLSEATLLSLRPGQIADIATKRPKIAAILEDFKLKIEHPISVILILNTAAATIGSAVAGSEFVQLFGEKWIWGFSVAFTIIILQFGEIVPKSLGVRFNSALAVIIAKPLYTLVVMLYPILNSLNWINRIFEKKGIGKSNTSTVEEISALAGLAKLTNQIGSQQERIIKGASKLSRMPVSQVMIPVEQISFLSTSQRLMDAVMTAHIDTHTRFPVREGEDNDNIVGYVNFKEMIYYMRTNPNEPNLRGITRPLTFVSSEDWAADLMKFFVEQHVHMAIVRSKDGKTLGLVTLEDLVEELVGEVEDEFDRLPKMFHTLTGGTWMVGGGVAMKEVIDTLKLPMPQTNETISAWLAAKIKRKPKAGDTYSEGYVDFLVRRVRRGKIFEAAVIKRID